MENIYFLLKEPQGWNKENTKEDAPPDSNKTPKSDLRETPIYVIAKYKVNDQWNNFKVSSGHKVKPSNWNFAKQVVRATAESGATRANTNSTLETYQKHILSIFSELKSESIAPTNEILKDRLLIKLGKKSIEDKKVVIDSITAAKEYYLKELITKTKNKGREISNRTKYKYDRIVKVLEDFERETGRDNKFENISINFYSDLIEYLNAEELALNTIGEHVKIIKAIMNFATRKGWNKNLDFLNEDFEVLRETGDLPYLTEREINDLHNADLTECKEYIRAARDWFLIGVYTGQRFSDWQQITPDRIEDSEFISVRQSKGDKEVQIWIRPEIFEIWERNGDNMPRLMSNQKFNQYIKTACKAAKITTPYVRTLTKGGKKQSITEPKFKLVGSHCARRSFISNNIANDIDRNLIKGQSGHHSDKVFEGYNRLEQRKKAELYRDQHNRNKERQNLKIG